MSADLVLLAEDDTDISEMLAFVLDSAGYLTVTARDGNTAATLVRSSRPSAIITDVRMPVMSGLELCRLVREDPELHDIPVLMISALGQGSDIAAGYAAGADDYLTKPLSPKKLIDSLGAKRPDGRPSRAHWVTASWLLHSTAERSEPLTAN